uniref:glutathione transferase n=1 Tax=Falco tinnunculus TaxID=100819 RepID=A0A8C4UM26_FALTI
MSVFAYNHTKPLYEHWGRLYRSAHLSFPSTACSVTGPSLIFCFKPDGVETSAGIVRIKKALSHIKIMVLYTSFMRCCFLLHIFQGTGSSEACQGSLGLPTLMEGGEWRPYDGCWQQLVWRIDMYVEGITDLMQMILMFPFSPPEAKEKNLHSIKDRATNRYFPVFEKVLKQHGQDFLVGNKFSWADVQLIEAILAVEEKIPAVLSGFPQLQAFKIRMSNMPTIKKFLQPGSPRKPPPDESYVETVLKIFKK